MPRFIYTLLAILVLALFGAAAGAVIGSMLHTVDLGAKIGATCGGIGGFAISVWVVRGSGGGSIFSYS